jgi:hypothetical protein
MASRESNKISENGISLMLTAIENGFLLRYLSLLMAIKNEKSIFSSSQHIPN